MSSRRVALALVFLLGTYLLAMHAPAAGVREGQAQSRQNWMHRYDRPPTYDVVYQPNVMIPMRDGVTLATALYFPGRDGKPARGPFPVLLTRNMNDSSASQGKSSSARYFASRGYVVAEQTMRGRFKSGGGAFYLYGRQQFDGADAVEWLAKQEWSTGKVEPTGFPRRRRAVLPGHAEPEGAGGNGAGLRAVQLCAVVDAHRRSAGAAGPELVDRCRGRW